MTRRFPIPVAPRRRTTSTLVLALLGVVLLSPASAPAEEGFDLMRQITSQWLHPNIMLVMDRSGSMSFPVERSANWEWDDFATPSGGTYIFQTFAYPGAADHVQVGSWMVAADHTYRFSAGGLYDDGEVQFPSTGVGQGYWVRVHRELDPASLKTRFTGSSRTGSIRSNRSHTRIYCNTSGLGVRDLVQITSFPGHPELLGVYKILYRTNDYIEVQRMEADGSFLPYRNVNAVVIEWSVFGEDILTLREVRIGTTVPGAMEPREAAEDGFYDASYSTTLYVKRERDWHRGDLLILSGFLGAESVHNGGYIIRDDPQESHAYRGYWYFTVARWDADDTWDVRDAAYDFASGTAPVGRDRDLVLQRVVLPGRSLSSPGWYFAHPSRMAITKNVLGEHLTLHLPADEVAEAGVDGRDKPYYRFDGDGPVGGAYFDWYHKVWVGWDPVTADREPVADPDYTREVEPSDLVRVFSDVINWGLVTYNGSCDTQDLRVEVDPDDTAQAAVVASIEEYLDVVSSARGLVPSGGTPTRAGLERAKEALITGWSDTSGDHDSTWDQDSRRTCGRTYGVILMTDGVSNNCNPRNREWTDCHDDWEDFPAGRSDELWNLTRDGVDIEARTWVIGVSREVGRCELNYTAYRGRTDSSSPNDDAGFATASDPRLPEGTPGTYADESDYAFFTNSADELKAAFVRILASMGVGDYATAPPSTAVGTVHGTVSFLASTDYPSWEGHLRAIDLSESELLWDAAATLVSGSDAEPSRNAALERRIYTWDPDDDNAMVRIATGTAATLDAICGGCGVTDEVVDFIRGNDGVIPVDATEGSPRSRLLGAIINSTPAIVGPPAIWKQNQLHEHSSFESAYQDRHTLVWVGTSDGMVRAFDILDGAEVLALVPPDLLASQVELFEVYTSDPVNSPLGQPGLPSEHLYGVTNSMRFADVWVDDDDRYRTVMFITEGPGGDGLHAVDVTHPYPGREIGEDTVDADPDFGYGDGSDDPVRVLWSRTGHAAGSIPQLEGLGRSWSVPAVGATATEEWLLQVGAGRFDNPSNDIAPEVIFLDPVTGEPATGNLTRSTPELEPRDTFWVSNQAFADAVLWQDDSDAFQSDNLVNEGVQGDLNGRLWALTRHGNTMEADALVTLDQPEPIYYSAAVSGYPVLAPTHALYAFASGSFFETSSYINGPQIGTGAHFTPKIYLVAKYLGDDSLSQVAIPLGSLPDPDGGTLGSRSQVTAPPMIFTPREGVTEPPFALYLVYDPEATACVGLSYIVRVNFDPDDLAATLSDLEDHVEVYVAGEGTAGGFALAGDRVVVAQSDVGEGAEADLVVVPDLTIPVGGEDRNVTWWIELQ